MDQLDLPDQGGLPGFGQETGEIQVNLQATDMHTSQELNSKAEDPLPEVGIFAVDILKSESTIIRHWDAFSQISGQSIKLNTGSYTLRASHGSATSSGFDAIYYKGEQPFTVLGQQNQGVDVVCKLAKVKVAVQFGPQMQADYTDYYIDVQSGSGTAVRFAKTETRAAYFPAGNLKLTIYLTDEAGLTRSYQPTPMAGAAQDFITFKLDTKEQTGELGLTITTDTSVEEKQEEITLPSLMLPKAPPSITCSTLASGGTLTYTEGVAQEMKVNFRADGSLRSCLLKVNAPTLVARGWPQQIDLANLTEADAAAVAQMKQDGLKWFESMNSSVLSYIDFSELSKHLFATDQTVNYSFSIKLSDAFSQSSEETSYTLAVTSPAFALQPMAVGDVWSTKAYTTSQITAGNAALLTLQYKTPTSDWADCQVADRAVVGSAVTMTAKALPTTAQSGTAVTFRLKYNNHYSEERTVTTEAAMQVPNSNFETYCEYKYNSGNDINQYFWYASASATDKWWATRNPASASQLTGHFIGGKNVYTRNNGTTPVDNGTSGKAVEIKTTAWGRGNTSTVNGGGTKYNVTAGVLFIGDYSYVLSESGSSATVGSGKMTSETLTQGRPFVSRPARMKFQYKYAPQSGEQFEAYAIIQNRENGTVELGRAQVSSSVATQSVNNMTDLTLEFTYNPQYKNLKATHICIFFASCNKMNWAEGTNRPATTNSGTGTMHYGSALTLDNLVLDYTF